MTIVNLAEKQGVAFQLYDLMKPNRNPRKYAVKASSTLVEDSLLYTGAGNYSYSLYGPNGFVRFFSGNALTDELVQYDV